MEAILRKELISNKAACRLFLAVSFIILTALGAFVRIPLPFTPVPLTLQTFFVLLCGAFLGPTLGSLSQLSYIMLGLCGLPIFTGAGSGILYLSGPTGGYLAGFIAASLFLGRFIQRTRRFSACLALFILADLLLLFCGMIWLRLSLGLSFSRTFLIGVLPFLPGDFIKALVAAGLYLNLRTRIQEIL